jgi:hypothetical protein
MARTRLIGNYGKYASGALGAEVSTGTLTKDALYVVIKLGTSSTLPAGLEVGYIFKSDGTEDITSSLDVVKLLSLTDLCDIQSWSLDFTKDETEVTTLCSDQKEYLAGRADTSGSATGVFSVGTTDLDGGFVNKFVDIVRQADAGGAVTIDKIDDSNIFAILYKQDSQESGETETFYVMPATITSFSDSVSGSDAQSFTSAFRQAPNDEVKFQLVEITYA